MYEILFEMITKASPNQIIGFIEEFNFDFDYADKNGVTAIEVSSFYGNVEIVKYLHSKGANIHKADKNGSTALFSACYNGHVEIAEYLWMNGIDINLKDAIGRTPLYAACLTNEFAALDLFIEQTFGESLECRGHNNPLTRIVDKSDVNRNEGSAWGCCGAYFPGGCKKTYNLFPQKLNRARVPMALGKDIRYGFYYCGRRLDKHAKPNSEGWCGPDTGPQCDDCKGFGNRFRSQVSDVCN